MEDETRTTPGSPPVTTTLPTAPVPPPAGTGWSTPPKPEAPAQPAPWASGSPPPGEYGTDQASAEPKKRRRAPLLFAGLAIGAILGGGAGAAVTTVLDDDSATPATRSDLSAGSNDDGGNEQTSATSDVQQVAQNVLPSVVSIAVQSQFGEAGGTGVVISSDGEILTNNHVVAGAGQGGTVLVTFSDGTTAEAEVVGTDPLTDLAVIRARDASDLVPAELGSSSELAVGQQVVAIGSPLGLEGTVTTGIVSALDRPVVAGEQQGDNSVINALQTDAPINPGNSGGPLVNMDGQVVGINSAIATTGANSGSIGLGFSIPIDQAKPIVEELLDGQQATHALIGVGLPPQHNPDQRGAEVASVSPGSAADDAGLQEGDVITKVDDRIVADETSLIAAVRAYRPDDQVTLTYLRDGDEHTADITLGSDAQGT